MKKDRWKRKAKETVEDMITREEAYLNKQEVGSEEYNESQKRLVALQEQLRECEKTDIDSKDRFVKFILELLKVVGCGIVLPLFGLIVITAQEREISYVGAMKSLLGSFVPGKKF